MTTTIWGNRRTKQLVAAAMAGELVYSSDGALMHRGPDDAHIAATKRDTAIIAVLVDLGLLRRDPESGAVSAAGGP